MSNTPIIECKPSKWFKIRAVLVLLMLAFFTLWFLKDGYSGYRNKNVKYVTNQLFSEKVEGQDEYVVNAIEVFKAGEYTDESWKAYASQQTIPTPPVERGLLPRDYDYDTKWPEEIVNGYEALSKDQPYSMWKEFSGRMEWSIDPPEKLYDEGTIREQFIVGGVTFLLFLFSVVICIRIMGRSMAVTENSYIAPGGKEITYTAMKKIDMRKWDNKGIAVISYVEDGATKKAKVDGMVYGHFKEEDGAPAEKLFSHIIENFKGELIEYESDDEDEESEQVTEPSDDAESESPKS